jgi:hypothetical protein
MMSIDRYDLTGAGKNTPFHIPAAFRAAGLPILRQEEISFRGFAGWMPALRSRGLSGCGLREGTGFHGTRGKV